VVLVFRPGPADSKGTGEDPRVVKSNILLIGRPTEETNSLRKELRRQDGLNVSVATNSEQAIKTIVNELIHLLVFNTEILTRKKIALTNDLRELGQKFPVLILANSVMADAMDELEKSKSTVFLEKPFSNRDLYGLTDKLMGGRSVRQRFFRRFSTSQEGNFSKVPSMEHATAAHIRNLSQGGAFIEYEGKPYVDIGDQICLEIPLHQVHKEYKMKARVVWVSPPAPVIGRNGLGVEFIK
jgi:response regulator RpfG family c-di-GMP phosphodiesterase